MPANILVSTLAPVSVPLVTSRALSSVLIIRRGAARTNRIYVQKRALKEWRFHAIRPVSHYARTEISIVLMIAMNIRTTAAKTNKTSAWGKANLKVISPRP